MRHYDFHHLVCTTSSRRQDMHRGSRLLFLYRFQWRALGTRAPSELGAKCPTGDVGPMVDGKPTE